MKKYILIFLILIIFTGCNATYNLNINENSKIKEEVIVEIEDNEKNYNTIINFFKGRRIKKNKYKILRDGENLKISYYENYATIEDYILNSDIYKQVFDEISIDKNKSTTTLNTSSDFKKNELSINYDNSNYIDFLQVNIDSRLPVIYGNEDIKNEKVYTWIYNGKSLNKDINISFKNKSRLITIRTIIILFITFSILVSFLLVVLKKYKSKQSI